MTDFHCPKKIFREYDIRGIHQVDLSPEFAESLGYCYAEFLQEHFKNNNLSVSVGMDCRTSGPLYQEAFIKGIRKKGVHVTRLGIVTTPMTYFSVFHWNLDGGVMITGSHNPSNYNGFKICVGKNSLHGKDIQTLYEKMSKQSFEKISALEMTGKLYDKPVREEYLSYLVENCRGVKNKKIVLDAGSGTASIVAPELFKRLGAEVIPLYCELDGSFPYHHPDPTVPENLKDLQNKILETKADFGFAYDGDSDRIGLVDSQGKILYGDQIMILLSRDLLKHHPGATVISEVKSSTLLYQDIEKNGGKPLMWKTGHSLIKTKMKESGALLAGEMSGHIFFSDRFFGFDDAVYASMRLYEIFSDSEKTSAELLQDLPSMHNTPEIRVDCEEELKFKLVDTVAKKLSSSSGKVTNIDGVRIDFQDGWGLLRASNTQPVLVLRFEAVSKNRLEEIQSLFTSSLFQAAKEVNHPEISLQGAHG